MKLTLGRRRLAILAAGALVVGGVAVVPGVANAATACNVTYAANSWGTGFTASIRISNVGDPLTGWTLGFTFPGNQRITQGWSANWTQSGANVTATNMSWNGNLGTGASTDIGFNGSYSGTNASPTRFTINGVACNGQQNTAPTVAMHSWRTMRNGAAGPAHGSGHGPPLHEQRRSSARVEDLRVAAPLLLP